MCCTVCAAEIKVTWFTPRLDKDDKPTLSKCEELDMYLGIDYMRDGSYIHFSDFSTLSSVFVVLLGLSSLQIYTL